MAYEDDDDFVLPPNLAGENAFDLPAITNSVREILRAIGEDPEREGLVRTPERVARAYQEILGGYNTDPVQLVNGALFTVDYDEMVIVKDIEYYSLCEHHMLPFLVKLMSLTCLRGKSSDFQRYPELLICLRIDCRCRKE